MRPESTPNPYTGHLALVRETRAIVELARRVVRAADEFPPEEVTESDVWAGADDFNRLADAVAGMGLAETEDTPPIIRDGSARYHGYRLSDLETAYLNTDREYRQALAREEDLQLRLRKLEEALKPFSDVLAEAHDLTYLGLEAWLKVIWADFGGDFTVGDLQRLAEAVKQ